MLAHVLMPVQGLEGHALAPGVQHIKLIKGAQQPSVLQEAWQECNCSLTVALPFGTNR